MDQNQINKCLYFFHSIRLLDRSYVGVGSVVTALMEYKFTINKSELWTVKCKWVWLNDFTSCGWKKIYDKMKTEMIIDQISHLMAQNFLMQKYSVPWKYDAEKELSTIDIITHARTHLHIHTRMHIHTHIERHSQILKIVSAVKKETITRACVNSISVYLL